MRSRKFAHWVALATLATVASSCGLLGKKDDLSRLLDYNPEAVGCLNEAGNRFAAYYKGEITREDWEATWDCAVDSLGLFKRFVKSSDPKGYTRADVQALISRFMFTKMDVTDNMVAATFELKASLFGGSKELLGPEELDKLIEFLRVVKAESTQLLPFLVMRAREPSPDNLLALADAIGVAGERIGDSLHTAGNPMFSWGAAQLFADELSRMLNVEMPRDAVVWLSSLKVLLMAGTREGIEAEAWPRVFRAAVAYGGPAIAAFSVEDKYLRGPNATGEFAMKLAWKVKTHLMQTLDLYGGALPLTVLDQVIDSLPEGWLTIDRVAIKDALRPIASKLLWSHVPEAIDKAAIDMVFAKLDQWCRVQTHLEKLFERLDADSSGVHPDRFRDEANEYADELDPKDRPDIYRLILLAKQTRPLFLGNDKQMTFTPTQSHSLHNLSQFHWMKMVAEHLLQSYASDKKGGTVDDLKEIVDDFIELGRAFQVMDPTVVDMHIKRFREANLFTFASNGDKYIDTDEAMYYIAMLFSASSLSTRIREGTDAVCPARGQDILGRNWKDADCFRKEFFGNYRNYWDHFPLLIRYYSSLSDSSKLSFQKAVERAARRYGYSSQRIAAVDTDGFAGILQYVETVFARFDANQSQILTLGELMDAYPVFKGALGELGKEQGLDPNNAFMMEAVFTYTVRFGHTPEKDFWGIAHLGTWIAQKYVPGWKINASRLSIFKTIASISVPEPLPPLLGPGLPPATPLPSHDEEEDEDLLEAGPGSFY